MVKLYVARHGETDFNREGRYLGRMDVPLNSAGRRQAQQLAKKMEKVNIGVIYCSPLKRTLETAEFIKKDHGGEIIIDHNFIERSVGVYEGMTITEIKDKYYELYKKDITRIFDKAPPKGETINGVEERVFSSLNKIKDQDDTSSIMIVTHSFVAKVINKYFNSDITNKEFFDFKLINGETKEYILK